MAGDVVYVGCKMPNGVVLNLDENELINAQFGMIRVNKSPLPPVTLKGNKTAFGKPALVGPDDYAWTAVPVEFWTEWLKRNQDSGLIRDGFIKPAPTVEASKKIAREHEAERGQFPALLPDNDPRAKDTKVSPYDGKEGAQRAA